MKFLVILVAVTLNGVYSSSVSEEWNPILPGVPQSNREERLLFFMQVRQEPCVTRDAVNSIGTCMSFRDCKTFGGVGEGACARGLGTCCLFRKSCGAMTSQNNTYFVNPDYPEGNTNGGKCEMIVNRANDNICQMRLDFLSLNIAQPSTTNGICEDDVMTVTGGTSKVPTFCGINSGQHIYVDMDPNGSALKILVDADVNSPATRLFNIKISQISCDSSSRAPPGCLQYYMSTSGTVQSFNYPVMPAISVAENITRQLSNQEYTVCIRPEAGYCSASWTPNEAVSPYGFFVTGDSSELLATAFGDISEAKFDGNCTTDYILIPGGTFENAVRSANRYCGPAFPNPVMTTFKPFLLFAKTDVDEEPEDAGNIGFSLNFRQNLC